MPYCSQMNFNSTKVQLEQIENVISPIISLNFNSTKVQLEPIILENEKVDI